MLTFRHATPADIDALNALTRQSVMHWGYEPAFLDWEPDAITVFAADLTRDTIVVAEHADEHELIGYYGLRGSAAELALDKLFLTPAVIGRGFGRTLWEHAVATARMLGATHWTLYGDPNAAGFYTAMGATWTRAVPTSWPGWSLQVFRYDFPDEPS